ncbi:LCP family protein [Streptomyces indicus]|uniref:Anionic cell wall polymer biosynthesis enzyme, LytR-Cps2A-Psr (LCP) family n=1 Tax=Streptomyces indicus TaxID=417292 RepID=A0A1G9DFH7_9ACTN|nr:LCP family protein [Streptomyces indicus]SDK62603.1 Anionic cell wall polymer biosynthesis enzyme, LytR-Cps2A-Psr (LCP) family [Streptomyces indicus]
MNDRQYDPYASQQHGGQQYEIVGYDEYGQPVYQPVAPPQHGPQGGYDPYGGVPQQQGYGYDTYGGQYGTDGTNSSNGADGSYDPNGSYGANSSYGADSYGSGAGTGTGYGNDHPAAYGNDTAPSYDPYGQAGGTGQQPRVSADTGEFAPVTETGRYTQVQEPTAWVPQQHTPEEPARAPERDYRTEQFSFIEEPDEESEDVIDWLKFTESRTERREEAKRRGRNRMVALLVVLALVLVGGVGYLWYEGKLPFLSGASEDDQAATGPQKRDVIVVHLHNTNGKGTSTALLVDNTTTERGATVLLPNSLAVTDEDGQATTLGKSVDDDGSSGTREAVDGLLGTRIEGSWRLDTPFLNNLVDIVGNIDIDTNADVPDPKAKKKGTSPLVTKGEDQTLSGPMAVAYATYRAPGESEAAQLSRFGAVLQGVLRKLSTDPKAATTTVQTLGQIIEPPLTDQDLGSFLARLSTRAKAGDYDSTVLPVQQDGTVSQKATDDVVAKLLGGTVKNADPDAAVRINLSGEKKAVENARVDLVNGGWTVVPGTAGAGGSSQVTYADETRKAEAAEVAKTLGLPAGAVKKGKVAGNADIGVVLGSDYKVE